MEKASAQRTGWPRSNLGYWGRRRGSSVTKPVVGGQTDTNGHSVSFSSTDSTDYNNSSTSNNINKSDPSYFLGADTTEPQPQRGIPKPRTFSVLSSLTQSFSRGSLTSRGTSNRKVSTESTASGSVTHDLVTVRHDLPRAAKYPLEKALIGDQNDQATPTPVMPGSASAAAPVDARLITTAMPPEYWAGRFMALHDRFRSELLQPQRLARITKMHADNSLDRAHAGTHAATAPAAAALNNPSRSAYSMTRISRPADPGCDVPAGRNGYSRHTSRRIPQSATSDAILQTTSYGSSAVRDLPALLPPQFPYPRVSSYEQATLRLPVASVTQHHPASPCFQGASTKTNQDDRDGDVDDDDARCRRVFVHLEALCLTDAARASLRAWRVTFARRTRRLALLPSASSATASATTAGSDNLEHHGYDEDGNGGLGRRRGLVRKLRRSFGVGVVELANTGCVDDGERWVVESGRETRKGAGRLSFR